MKSQMNILKRHKAHSPVDLPYVQGGSVGIKLGGWARNVYQMVNAQENPLLSSSSESVMRFKTKMLECVY